MPSTPALRFTVLAQSQLDRDTLQSVLITLLRGSAAVLVAAAHLRSELYPGLDTMFAPPLWYQLLTFMTGFSHQALVVFLLISGYLVGGGLLDRFHQPDALKLYAIDRVTRLWSVLIPGCLLMLAGGVGGGAFATHRADGSSIDAFGLLAFAGNLLGLQGIWVPEYGGNFALETLAYVTWCYALFPLLLCFVGAVRWPKRIVPGALLLAIGVLLPLPLLLYFSLWLLGAGCSRMRIDASAKFRWLTCVLLVSVSVYVRLLGKHGDLGTDTFLQDLCASLPLLVLLAAAHQRVDQTGAGMCCLRRCAQMLTNMSLSLCVIHLPLIWLLREVSASWLDDGRFPARTVADLGLYAAMLAGVLVCAYGFYWLFEARTVAIRELVKELLPSKAGMARRPA